MAIFVENMIKIVKTNFNNSINNLVNINNIYILKNLFGIRLEENYDEENTNDIIKYDFEKMIIYYQKKME